VIISFQDPTIFEEKMGQKQFALDPVEVVILACYGVNSRTERQQDVASLMRRELVRTG
jgi:hypothetical protein